MACAPEMTGTSAKRTCEPARVGRTVPRNSQTGVVAEGLEQVKSSTRSSLNERLAQTVSSSRALWPAARTLPPPCGHGCRPRRGPSGTSRPFRPSRRPPPCWGRWSGPSVVHRISGITLGRLWALSFTPGPQRSHHDKNRIRSQHRHANHLLSVKCHCAPETRSRNHSGQVRAKQGRAHDCGECRIATQVQARGDPSSGAPTTQEQENNVWSTPDDNNGYQPFARERSEEHTSELQSPTN